MALIRDKLEVPPTALRILTGDRQWVDKRTDLDL